MYVLTFNTYKKYGYELNNSPFLLPYNIKYMFDVLSIKPLKNSISRNEIKKMKNSINLFLSGEIKELIFYNGKFSDLNSNILMEFKSNLILNKDIYIKVKSEKEVDDLIHNLVKENIPSNKINIVLDIDNEIQVYNYFEKHNIITIKKNDVINDGSISIVNIDTFKLVEDIINKRIPNPFLDSSKIILNKCKFCYGKCYITESKRGIINMKKNVLNICYSGEYINLMDEYEFRKFINEKKKKEYEERKCNLCEVNYRCPKCLYPAPLSVKEYCKVMKQFSFYFNDIDFIDEYCSKYKLPSSYKNILYKFRKNLNKDINKLTYQDFIKSIENKNITKEQLKIIIDFLKYFKR